MLYYNITMLYYSILLCYYNNYGLPVSILIFLTHFFKLSQKNVTLGAERQGEPDSRHSRRSRNDFIGSRAPKLCEVGDIAWCDSPLHWFRNQWDTTLPPGRAIVRSQHKRAQSSHHHDSVYGFLPKRLGVAHRTTRHPAFNCDVSSNVCRLVCLQACLSSSPSLGKLSWNGNLD